MTQFLGSLIIDIDGIALTQEDIEILKHPLVGGIIFFARNYHSSDQLTQLTHSIRAVRQDPLLIMVDQEGGRVQRFIKDFTRLPPVGRLGEIYDREPAKALGLAKEFGWLMAAELLTTGIDLSLAPVLDLRKEISKVIGDRAFHFSPAIISELAKQFVIGMNEAGMAAVGKHFPGHGSVSIDSHVGVPIDVRDMQQIESEDLKPFLALIRAGIHGIMAAHIVFPNLDSRPVSYSRFWLQQVLREQLKFSGAIFSDDLNMEGANISSSYADRVTESREAGCDFALVCNNRSGVIDVLDNVVATNHMVSHDKWGVLQGDFSRQRSQADRLQTAKQSVISMTQNHIQTT